MVLRIITLVIFVLSTIFRLLISLGIISMNNIDAEFIIFMVLSLIIFFLTFLISYIKKQAENKKY